MTPRASGHKKAQKNGGAARRRVDSRRLPRYLTTTVYMLTPALLTGPSVTVPAL